MKRVYASLENAPPGLYLDRENNIWERDPAPEGAAFHRTEVYFRWNEEGLKEQSPSWGPFKCINPVAKSDRFPDLSKPLGDRSPPEPRRTRAAICAPVPQKEPEPPQ